MLKILIFGAGAIGCFVGGSLAAAGHRVTLLGRAPLMHKIAADGLSLRWPDLVPITTSPETCTSIDDLSAPYDFILLTVKSPDTAPAGEQLLAHPDLLTDGYLVSLQNGIGNEEQLAAALGPAKIIAGTITIPIEAPALGQIAVSKAKGGLGLAPVQPPQPVKRLAAALNQAGLQTTTFDDYRAMKWSKLLLNIVNNGTSAILNLPPAQIIAQPELFNLEIESLREGVAVMKAQNIEAVKLPGYPVDWLFWLIDAGWLPLPVKRAILRPFMLSGRGSKMPSLQIDLAAKRSSSEIDALNGAIVEAGKRVGVATPVNQVLTKILRGLVSGELDWNDYQKQPGKLLQIVAAHRARLSAKGVSV